MMNTPAMIRVLGHALVVGCLLLVPAFWLAPPTIWRLSVSKLLVLACLLAAYLVSLFAYRISNKPGTGHNAAHAFLVSVAVFSTFAAVLMLMERFLPAFFGEPYRIEAVVAGWLVGIGGFALLHTRRLGVAASFLVLTLTFVTGFIGQAAYQKRWLPRPIPPSVSRTVSHTSLYQLQLTRYDNWIPQHWRKGGGLAAWGDDYLVATGNGSLFVVAEREGTGLEVTLLPRPVPLNVAEFVAGAREIFRSAPTSQVESSRFRVADILVQERGDSVRLLVSHHYWHVDRKCFVLRISALEASRKEILDARAKLDWRTVFETSPCLSLNTGNARGPRFEGMDNGGRMALLTDDRLLLTVGDHGFDGVNRPEFLAQDPAASYGKILEIDLLTGNASLVSMGHRNPQGLLVAADGTVWETEHGPQGGDELNIIRAGANYGWPIVTYGTDYSRHSWPLNAAQGRHEGFERPMLAFTPSIAISNLTEATGDRFPLWKGDLLVTSLKQGALLRLRVEEGRVVVAEPIPIGRRMRDILIGHDGRILLWTDESELIFVEPTDANIGDALISQCTGCHGFGGAGSTLLGPNLRDIVGRRVAARDDFRYSKAIRDLDGRWTRQRLDAFLADPQEFAPRNQMQFAGIPDGDDRAKLIDFLADMPGQE